MKKITLIQLLIILSGFISNAQLTYKDYQRADSAVRLNNLVYNAFIRPEWIDTTDNFWYRTRTKEGDMYFLVDAVSLKKEPAFDIRKLCDQVNLKTGKQFRPDSFPVRNLRFRNNLKEIEFVTDSTKWNYNIRENLLEDKGTERRGRSEGYWGTTSGE
jgi:hypothetical protein